MSDWLLFFWFRIMLMSSKGGPMELLGATAVVAGVYLGVRYGTHWVRRSIDFAGNLMRGN
jgi:hypothetical protein